MTPNPIINGSGDVQRIEMRLSVIAAINTELAFAVVAAQSSTALSCSSLCALSSCQALAPSVSKLRICEQPRHHLHRYSQHLSHDCFTGQKPFRISWIHPLYIDLHLRTPYLPYTHIHGISHAALMRKHACFPLSRRLCYGLLGCLGDSASVQPAKIAQQSSILDAFGRTLATTKYAPAVRRKLAAAVELARVLPILHCRTVTQSSIIMCSNCSRV